MILEVAAWASTVETGHACTAAGRVNSRITLFLCLPSLWPPIIPTPEMRYGYPAVASHEHAALAALHSHDHTATEATTWMVPRTYKLLARIDKL